MTIQPLIQKTTLLVYNQNAFNISDINSPSTYKSLNSIVSGNDNNVKNGNDTYFRQFFGYLKSELLKNNADNKEIEEEQKRLSGDDDIITETYYSFKTINDKWLCDMIKTNGYPFNYKISETGNNYSDLIDSFAFVDRAMNPIGDTVINPEILLDLYNDTNVSVFSVLSQLLSMNGFEFFPLQNFMSYSDDEWLNVMFKLDPGGAVTRRPAFVCMYIGGTSNYLSNNVNGFKNDGIENIGASGLQDFESSCIPTDNPDDKQFENNPNFPWKQVRSFSVKFGQQNQSMFTDIKIDSKEFPETNESIQLLSRLAGDEGKNAPIPKGQNLYNVYENRAYRATITGLGNAMIQPTQYFQLDNIPMYNGAYVILSVEHVIVPNKMTTTFSGTKILKYPIPRVTNPAAVMGFEGGSAESTISSNTPGEIIQKFSPDKINNNMAKYDSMYTTLIQ